VWFKEISYTDFETENLDFLKISDPILAEIWLPLSEFPLTEDPVSTSISLEIVQQINLKDPENPVKYKNDFTFEIRKVDYGMMRCNLNCLLCENSYSCVKCEKGMVWDENKLECKLPYIEKVTVTNLSQFLHVFGKFIEKKIN
jgi:hypothetical protein